MVLSTIRASTDADTESYPEEDSLLTISPWHNQSVIGPIIWEEYFNVHPFIQGDFFKAPLE